jgi:hypothetical protein
MRARARPESLRYLSTSSLHELRQQTAIKKKKEKRKKKKEKSTASTDLRAAISRITTSFSENNF